MLRYDGGPDYSGSGNVREIQLAPSENYLLDYSGRMGARPYRSADRQARGACFRKPFARLQSFWTRPVCPMPSSRASIRRFQFYVAYLACISDSGKPGGFCRPELSRSSRSSPCMALSTRAGQPAVIDEKAPVVCNDFHLADGLNASSSSPAPTRAARRRSPAWSANCYLARLGCMVPGSAARLFLCDALFAHFERQEDIRNLRGKLQDDLVRIKQILDCTTPGSC